MTKKHFKALAEQLRDIRPNPGMDAARYDGWFAAVMAVARACHTMNPRFNRERFYAACGAEA